MATDYGYKSIWKMAYPILFSLIVEQLIGIIDTAFMGRVGEVELGAVALAGVFYMVVFMAGHGFCVGAQILIARRNGEGQQAEVGQVFYQGLYFLMALAVVLFAACQTFDSGIFSMMVSSPNVLAKAEAYLHYRVYGFFFAFASGMFQAFYIGTQRTRILTFNSIVMVLANVLFNYILVFGKFGCPALGIAGAAIGSSLSELVSLVFFIVFTRFRIDCGSFGLLRMPRIDFQRMRSIIGLSLWVMIQNTVSLSTWFLFFVFIEHLGEQSLAVANVVRSINGLLFMAVSAFSSACSSIVSNMIGSGQSGEVGIAIRRHILLNYICVLPVVIAVALFPYAVIGIYTDIPGMADAATPSVWMMCSSYLLLIPSDILLNSVSGTGNTRMAFYLEIPALAVYVAYITVLIYYCRADVMWSWTVDHLYGLTLVVACCIYLSRGTWRNRKI